MKSFVFCTSYANYDPQRYQDWINYYYPKMKDFGAAFLFLIDDGSRIFDFHPNLKVIDAEMPLPDVLENDLNMLHFSDNLGRTWLLNYAGWWRSFTFSVKIAQKYSFDKIIHIESDFYVVSSRFINYLKEVNKGWTAFWSQKNGFPETAVQVICSDSFPKLEKFYKKGRRFFVKSRVFAERVLPFTKIEKGFVGERYGEKIDLSAQDVPDNVDYIGQVTRMDLIQKIMAKKENK